TRALEVIVLLQDHQDKEITLIGPHQEKFKELCDGIADLERRGAGTLDARFHAWRGEDNQVDVQRALSEYKRVTDNLQEEWIQRSVTLANLLSGYVFVQFAKGWGQLKDEMLVF